MQIDTSRLLSIDPKVVPIIIPILHSFNNGTEKYDEFQFRKSMTPYILVSILSYSMIFMSGLLMNFRLIRWITRFRPFLCSSHSFLFSLLLGNSLNDLFIKDLIVLPISFTILTGVHWTMGETCCRLFPLLQDSCFHVTSLTLLAAFYYRYKQISEANFNSITQDVQYPDPPPLPSFFVISICWFISIIGVIPHTVFITYLDLGELLGESFRTTGICAVNLEDNIAEYIRFLFALFYMIPLVLCISYHFKTVDILKRWKKSNVENRGRGVAIVHRGSVVDNIFHPNGRSSIASIHSNIPDPSDANTPRFSYSSVEHHVGGPRGGSLSMNAANLPRRSRTMSLAATDDRTHHSTVDDSPPSSLNLEEETERMMVRIFTVHTIFLLPLNVLRFTKHLMSEPEDMTVFDLIFIVFVGVQFLTTVSTPWLVLRTCPVYLENDPEMIPENRENLQLFRMNLIESSDQVN